MGPELAPGERDAPHGPSSLQRPAFDQAHGAAAERATLVVGDQEGSTAGRDLTGPVD
jgi:hypothetical protein